MIEFTPYPKTARLFKDGLGMVISEKLDGTNAAVVIGEPYTFGHHANEELPGNVTALAFSREADASGMPTYEYVVGAQSRNRVIQPVSISGNKASDNYGFAAWVKENSEALANVLGPGVHFGEWWGQGIARNYGLTEKRFSLFNTSRFAHLNSPEARLSLGVPGQLGVVPVLWSGQLDRDDVMREMRYLEMDGSTAAPGFMKPEGVCVYLPTVRQTFKVTFEGDQPKWALEAVAAQAALSSQVA